MKYSKSELWRRFQTYYHQWPSIGLALDLSRMNFEDDFFASMAGRLKKAFAAMAALEGGTTANPDEKRMVGHYWLRNPDLAPNPQIRQEIIDTLAAIKSFAAEVHSGQIHGATGPFRHILLIGIGGSALGPQFVSHALGSHVNDKLALHCLDNTDPDGFDNVFAKLRPVFGQTLCVVISKSGGTKENRNGMVETEVAYKNACLNFGQHSVAITMTGSKLYDYATQHSWLKTFPMWDWVGGRTSETSAVGLLPAALQGLDIDGLLAGARACDEITRQTAGEQNPAAQLALMWYYIGKGKGTKDMVVLPYKDRLELFSRYLQQLIMESLGKERDLKGKVVHQGLSVYGNKGSTDQHAYVQQLREGIANFFVTFIQVLQDRKSPPVFVEDEATSGDYLAGFYLGTRQALYENDRESLSIIIDEVSPFAVGVLIALFERTVGLYASLININPYHQPGVEAGKKAAEDVLALQRRLVRHLKERKGTELTPAQLANELGVPDCAEDVFHICEHLAANGRLKKQPAQNSLEASFGCE
jgi:glucose-6-phosphate isomerase